MSRSRCVGSLVLFGLLFVALPAGAQNRSTDLPDGIVSVSTRSPAELQQMLRDGYRAEIPWDEAFGEFAEVNAYVPDLTADEVWNFVQDIRNFKYWTMSQYDCQPYGTYKGRNRYSAVENFPPFGNIYLAEEKHPEVKTVEWWVGWWDSENLWMHYYVRVLDAEKFMGKPGAIIIWVNFGHENYKSDPMLYQGFRMMRIAHAVERDNMIKILRWRAAGNAGPLTQEVLAELGLINGFTRDFMDIWFMLVAGVKPSVNWNELYGGFISSHMVFLDAPKDKVWQYLTNLQNMNDWTVSTRFVIPFHDNFVAYEMLAPTGILLADTDVDQTSQTLDIRMSKARYHREFGGDKWMTSSFRVKDAAEVVGKPGTVVFWTTYHHENYDALPELAEEWKYLPVRNWFAAENMRILLSQP
jgi:carbon monoxide dehydrogenase subunit G